MTKKKIRISKYIFILMIILSLLLFILALIEKSNTQIITVFSEILKVLAGALVGALAGEKIK